MGDAHDAKEVEQDLLLSNPSYQPFLEENFNPADFTSKVLAGSQTTAQGQSEELRAGVKEIEIKLCGQIVAKHSELLQCARKLLDTEHTLQDTILSVESLQSAVKRVRAEIIGPYEQIKAKSRQSSNLHATVDLLRHLIHRIKLTQKLRVQLSGQPAALDLAKAAKLLTDIEAVSKGADFRGNDVVAADEEFIKGAGTSIRDLAQAALTEGMESLSQAKVGSALQVFFNLDELDQAVNGLIHKYAGELEKRLRQAVDARQLGVGAAAAAGATQAGRGTTQGLTSGGSWQENLWSSVKEFCDQLAGSAVAVWHLQRVVAKKRDPLTHVCFADLLLDGTSTLTDIFWDSVTGMVAEVLGTVGKPGKGGLVRDMLTGSYPRLAAALEVTFDKLVADTSMRGAAPAASLAHLHKLLAATGVFQSAYLSTSLARMTEVVSAAFPGSSRALASPAEVQKCIGCIHEELKVGGSHPQLCGVLAGVVGRALRLMAEKADLMAASGPDVKALAPPLPANAQQLRNMALCSQLQEVHRSLAGLLPRLPSTAGVALAPSLDLVLATALDAVAPIFRSAAEALEERLLRMHAALGGGAHAQPGAGTAGCEDGAAVVNTSHYILDVSQYLAHFRSEFLQKFTPVPGPNAPSCASSLAERLACRVLIFFVRHVGLLRPLTQSCKLQVAKDMSELQLAVGQSLWPLEQLGAPHRALRALRTLLFTDTLDFASSPALKDLPPGLVLHHLFSRLPATLQAPHERSGLTPAQYSRWLDQHGPAEVLARIRAALDSVDAATQQHADVAPVYTTMTTLCSLFAHAHSPM